MLRWVWTNIQSDLLHCVVFHLAEIGVYDSVVLLQPALEVCAQQREWEEAAQCVSVNQPPTSAHQRALPSVCGAGFGEFSWNTHILHCRGHKQLSISSNPLFRINRSFSCSFLSRAVTFLWLIKFSLADGAQQDAWQVTYIGVSNPLQHSHK